MSTLAMEDAIITLVTEGTADADYTRRRDVRSRLVTAGPAAAWAAIRGRSEDFEVSGPFPVTAPAEVPGWHRGQACTAASPRALCWELAGSPRAGTGDER